MCDICTQKADHMLKLSRFFREAAAETRLVEYQEIMTRSADDLDDLRQLHLKGCRCGQDPAVSFGLQHMFAVSYPGFERPAWASARVSAIPAASTTMRRSGTARMTGASASNRLAA